MTIVKILFRGGNCCTYAHYNTKCSIALVSPCSLSDRKMIVSMSLFPLLDTVQDVVATLFDECEGYLELLRCINAILRGRSVD